MQAGNGWSLRQLCELLEVNRAWYYQRQRKTESATDPDVELRDAIERLVLEFPGYGYRRVTVALQRAGFYVARQKGSHVQMRRDDPPPARTVPVPMSKKPLPRGTLRAIIRLAGLTADEFITLLE